ncbi:hypothetical protein MNV49_005951 [Pseudohyphozyma bogoriensis]|nr:hypothetical protein MNV49_005951 [Pseudohyphozyma bogoriensis]
MPASAPPLATPVLSVDPATELQKLIDSLKPQESVVRNKLEEVYEAWEIGKEPLKDVYHSVVAIGKLTLDVGEKLPGWVGPSIKVLVTLGTLAQAGSAVRETCDGIAKQLSSGFQLLKEQNIVQTDDLDHAYDTPSPDPLPSRPQIFGRDNVVAELISLIRDGKHPVLVGTGGLGKSTVAQAILHSDYVTSAFDSRRYFFRCDELKTAIAVRDELLRIRRYTLEDGESPWAALACTLGPQPTFVVLDNFESPTDGDTLNVQQLVRELVKIPSLQLLLTTRNPSINPSARIPGLQLHYLEKLARDDSKKLFLHVSPFLANDTAFPLLSLLVFLPFGLSTIRISKLQELGIIDPAARRDLLRTSLATSVYPGMGLALRLLAPISQALKKTPQLPMPPPDAIKSLVRLYEEEATSLCCAPYPSPRFDFDNYAIVFDAAFKLAQTESDYSDLGRSILGATTALAKAFRPLLPLSCLGKLSGASSTPTLRFASYLHSDWTSESIESALQQAEEDLAELQALALLPPSELTGKAWCLYWLGRLAEQGRMEESFTEALTLFSPSETTGRAWYLRELGHIKCSSNAAEAEDLFAQALALDTSPAGRASCLYGIGYLIQETDPVRAESLFYEALALYSPAELAQRASCLCGLVNIKLKKNNIVSLMTIEDASQIGMHLQEAWRLYLEIGHEENSALCMKGLLCLEQRKKRSASFHCDWSTTRERRGELDSDLRR